MDADATAVSVQACQAHGSDERQTVSREALVLLDMMTIGEIVGGRFVVS
jgi:hypothetical protein